MKVKEALAQAREALTTARIEEAVLESNLLLRHVLGINPVELYLDFDRELTAEQIHIYRQLVQRRIRGEPSAYLTGRREFYGRDFYVDSRVLIPRPETELLVEKAIELVRRQAFTTIADIGTGSGAIAVTLAKELPGVTVYATDASAAALEVAGRNRREHGVIERMVLLLGDLLDPLSSLVDLIVANLPYVRKSELPRLSAEPRIALDGGSEGLDKITALCHQVGEKLSPEGCLLLEVGMGQAQNVVALLKSLYPQAQVKVFRDLAGIERVVNMRLFTKDL
ncbi:MAG: peptide chain release factor N(5)-glutamine methyltransferase [Dehalococcoidales bacterium]|nr:peptide chain release factor N(5)-glutamine methyltransferase [Dehalococcoidales bacterium]